MLACASLRLSNDLMLLQIDTLIYHKQGISSKILLFLPMIRGHCQLKKKKKRMFSKHHLACAFAF